MLTPERRAALEREIRCYKGFIFDMDGTLMNSEIRHHDSWRTAARAAGFPELSTELLYSLGGLPSPEIVKRLNAAFGMHADLTALSLEKSRIYNEECLQLVEPFERICSLLRSLKAEGRRTALATSSHAFETRYLITKTGIAESLDAVITGDMVERGKPNPDIFLLASKKLNLRPEDCLVFEDTDTGMLCARNAKMDAVRVFEGDFLDGSITKSAV